MRQPSVFVPSSESIVERWAQRTHRLMLAGLSVVVVMVSVGSYAAWEYAQTYRMVRAEIVAAKDRAIIERERQREQERDEANDRAIFEHLKRGEDIPDELLKRAQRPPQPPQP